MTFKINIKRIYETPSAKDGLRILIDRLWPRGVTKERAHINYWYKEITPSSDLRKWFGHKPERFREFAKLYQDELTHQTELLEKVKEFSKKQPVTLLYAAKDPKINHAIVLKEVLDNI